MRIFIFLVFFASGCIMMYSRGYYNEYKQFVPKNPRFKFKDKGGLVRPDNLSFDQIYRLTVCTYLGKQTYPVDSTKFNYQFDPRYNVSYYFLFFENGRVLKFSTPTFLKDGSEYQLKPDDISEKRAFVSKEYWYSDSNSKEIQIEAFFSANGQGKYSISNAIVEKGTLSFVETNHAFQDISVYTLAPLDKSLIDDFKIDW